jgi:hypothetical protein
VLTSDVIVTISLDGVTDMTRRHLLGLFFVFSPTINARDQTLSKKQCDALDKQMKRIQSRLRQGYSARQGRKYKARMRDLQLRRFRHCR